MPQSQKARSPFMKKQSAKSAKLVIALAIFCLALAWAAASARATAIEYQFVPAKSSLPPAAEWPHTHPANAGIRVEFQLPFDCVMK